MQDIKMQTKITGQGQMGYLLTCKAYQENKKTKPKVIKAIKQGQYGNSMDEWGGIIEWQDMQHLPSEQKNAKLHKAYRTHTISILIKTKTQIKNVVETMKKGLDNINAKLQVQYNLARKKEAKQQLCII